MTPGGGLRYLKQVIGCLGGVHGVSHPEYCIKRQRKSGWVGGDRFGFVPLMPGAAAVRCRR
jgi:hypothetical protein